MPGPPPKQVGVEHRGPAFPLTRGREGLFPRRNERALRQSSIMMILGTIPGERVGEPEFGSLLYTRPFEPNDVTTAHLARQYVVDALARWDPFVKVVNTAIEQSGNQLTIFIDYIDLAAVTQEVRQAVFPLRRG